VRRNDHRFEVVDLLELVGLVSAVPVMPASFLYMPEIVLRNVIDASV
jgi:hypothetical protein